MTLDEFLAQNDPTRLAELSEADRRRLFWRFKGLGKQVERDSAFWNATNENLKLSYEKLDEQERELARAYHIIREDLEVAEQIQHALLPKLFPDMERELELAVYHKQLNDVGGDYYDFFRTREGGYAIGVFDISGHGVSAALIMSFLKAQFMNVMAAVDSPGAIVDRVNAVSFDFLREVRRYATVNFVQFHARTVRYVSGGGYGLLIRANGAEHTFNKLDPFIGLRQKPYREYELPFGGGDVLVLYTDGMVEAQDARGVDYSVKRMNEIVRTNAWKPANEILRACVDDYTNFRARDSDDITLIVLRKRRA